MDKKQKKGLIHIEYNFYQDDSYIYYNGFIIGGIISENVYVLHPNYIADDLYFCYCNISETNKLISVYFKADFNSFDVFPDNPNFSEDRYTVYYNGQALLDFDISSSIYLGEDYIKDEKSVYWGSLHIPLANPVLFTLLGEGYATDGNYYFHKGVLLNTMEPLQVLGSGYATDGTTFWKNGIVLSSPSEDHYIIDILGKI